MFMPKNINVDLEIPEENELLGCISIQLAADGTYTASHHVIHAIPDIHTANMLRWLADVIEINALPESSTNNN